jgi:hypothetical protein
VPATLLARADEVIDCPTSQLIWYAVRRAST